MTWAEAFFYSVAIVCPTLSTVVVIVFVLTKRLEIKARTNTKKD